MKMFEDMLRTRRILLFEGVNQDSINVAIDLVGAFLLSGVSNAEVFINSSGGSLELAQHLYDVIIASKINFRGLVMGKCMSAAVTVLQACQVRHALPNTRLLVHKGTRKLEYTLAFDSLIEEAYTKLKVAHEEIKLVEIKNKTIIQSRIKDLDLFESYYKEDKVFFAEDALKMGLIDEIVTTV